MKIRKTLGERTTDFILRTVMILIAFITLYPFIYVFSMSISGPEYVIKQEVWFLPKGFSLQSYRMVFENKFIWKAYYNTIWYTVVGTIINVIMTIIAAYPLSRRLFFMKRSLTFFITFTMFFGGGMIPLFILVSNLGLYNTRWAMVLPNAVGAYYIVVARSFFQTIPDSLEESAKLDGANDISILFNIMMPLSKPIISVLILFYAVGHWNSFFNALIYLSSSDLHPLQIFLRRVLLMSSEELADDINAGFGRSAAVSQLKYAAIIFTILPILFVYPFLQKYFTKGVMIGAIKA